MTEFIPFKKEHLSLFSHWLNQEHVEPYWQESSDDEELAGKFLVEYPKRGLSAFVIQVDGKSVGFIQSYEARKVGNGWWPDEKSGTFGIDIILGDPQSVGKGLGPKVISDFIKFLALREPSLKEIIIDPHPKNRKAIRAFEKAGFVFEKNIVTPGGPAALMRLKVNVRK
jgi:RimJ/RimL family protein N-acetyltransferase